MNINNWNEKDFSNSRKQSENYLKDYKILISKGLKNWTKTDFKRAVASLAAAALYEAQKNAIAAGDEEKSQSYKTTENAYYSANSKDPSIKELDSALNDLLTNDPYISNQLQKVNNLIALGNIEAPAVGPQYKRFLSSKKERKQEKERKQKIKDEGYEGAGFLPMDFKEGGRSKLI